jgi:hypothetical protein
MKYLIPYVINILFTYLINYIYYVLGGPLAGTVVGRSSFSFIFDSSFIFISFSLSLIILVVGGTFSFLGVKRAENEREELAGVEAFELSISLETAGGAVTSAPADPAGVPDDPDPILKILGGFSLGVSLAVTLILSGAPTGRTIVALIMMMFT